MILTITRRFVDMYFISTVIKEKNNKSPVLFINRVYHNLNPNSIEDKINDLCNFARKIVNSDEIGNQGFNDVLVFHSSKDIPIRGIHFKRTAGPYVLDFLDRKIIDLTEGDNI